jgi:hypothetical protein
MLSVLQHLIISSAFARRTFHPRPQEGFSGAILIKEELHPLIMLSQLLVDKKEFLLNI